VARAFTHIMYARHLLRLNHNIIHLCSK
jgi:hypothetical protein